MSKNPGHGRVASADEYLSTLPPRSSINTVSEEKKSQGISSQYRSESFDGFLPLARTHSGQHSLAPLSDRKKYSTERNGNAVRHSEGNQIPFGLRKGSYGSIDEESPLIRKFHGVEMKSEKQGEGGKSGIIYYFMYALLNTLMSVPALYGYASVIFNHDAFQPYIAVLTKLSLWSSAVHQLVFVAFSSLPFAKAEVQDAGLLFLSCITNYIARSILDEGGGIEEILSTAIIGIAVATASLGFVVLFLGKFNCANFVSYLPLPVVGGYLAFIGYFCFIAGVGLSVSQSMIDGNFLSDIELLSNRKTLSLALPGLISGVILVVVCRFAKSDATLPLTMVAIPIAFYIFLYVSDISIEEARSGMWIGEKEPAADIMSLFAVLDINKVRWDLIICTRCISVWIGMVFVVSFSSCLDVAAISMDMGEALDVNAELVTVGLSNIISGCTLGQTGSYIFSQTILTFKTGYHSRWIGVMGGLMFLGFVFTSVNLLEIVPLFFLGSTLIFIGLDLLYEWLIHIHQKLILSEYLVLLATFTAIQMVGIDAGIIIGIVVALVEYVVFTSKISTLRRVMRQSRAVRQPHQRKLVQDVIYSNQTPKIVTLEIRETVFFGSSLGLLSKICEEININASSKDMIEIAESSPRLHSRSPSTPTPPSLKSLKEKRKSIQNSDQSLENKLPAEVKKAIPRFVVLDMTHVPSVDASAARSCFLQLARICKTNGIILCAACSNLRIIWTLRTHDVLYTSEEESEIKKSLTYPHIGNRSILPEGKLLLFDSIHEALFMCENRLIYELEHKHSTYMNPVPVDVIHHSSMHAHNMKTKISTLFSRILGDNSLDKDLCNSLDNGNIQIEEIDCFYGDTIFSKGDSSECFYVVLAGSVDICRPNLIDESSTSKFHLDLNKSDYGDIVSYLHVGALFGYVDFVLDRRRSLSAVCGKNGTILARITKATLEQLQNENNHVYHTIEKILLQVAIKELSSFEVA